jgi:hypothetical protein
MFTLLRSQFVVPCVGLTLGALFAIALAGFGREARQLPPRAATTIVEVAERLQPLGLRVVPLRGSDDPERGVFLTTSGKSRQELAACTWGDESPEGLKPWQGILQVRHLTGWYGGANEDVQLPGVAVWRWGRFVFFGDPELLDKVRLTLAEGEGKSLTSSRRAGSAIR